MKSFKSYIKEDKGGNSSSNLAYKATSGGQQATAAAIAAGTQSGLSDFSKMKVSSSAGQGGIDVKQWWGEDEEMKPWQIRCADYAATRHAEHMKWLSAVDPNHTNTHPELPDWQTLSRKK